MPFDSDSAAVANQIDPEQELIRLSDELENMKSQHARLGSLVLKCNDETSHGIFARMASLEKRMRRIRDEIYNVALQSGEFDFLNN